MSTFAKVLLATDLTPQSDNLTECLFSLCPDTETEVVLAHVFDDDDDADPDGSNYKKVNSRLEGYKNDLEQAGYEEVTIVTPVGDEPFEAICDAGEEHEADLLMVASHGKGFLKSTLMGSTTFDLARATTLPLFISKEDNKDASKLLDTILIPTDFSQKSLDCLNVVRGLREYIGNVIFIHVIERYRSKEEYKEKYGNARLFLQELVDELKIFGIKADYDKPMLIEKELGDGITKIQTGKYKVEFSTSDIISLDAGMYVFDLRYTIGSTPSIPLSGYIVVADSVFTNNQGE